MIDLKYDSVKVDESDVSTELLSILEHAVLYAGLSITASRADYRYESCYW